MAGAGRELPTANALKTLRVSWDSHAGQPMGSFISEEERSSEKTC